MMNEEVIKELYELDAEIRKDWKNYLSLREKLKKLVLDNPQLNWKESFPSDDNNLRPFHLHIYAMNNGHDITAIKNDYKMGMKMIEEMFEEYKKEFGKEAKGAHY